MSVNLPDKFRSARFLAGSLCFLSLVCFNSTLRPADAQAPAQSGGSFNMRVEVELVTTEVVVLCLALGRM